MKDPDPMSESLNDQERDDEEVQDEDSADAEATDDTPTEDEGAGDELAEDEATAQGATQERHLSDAYSSDRDFSDFPLSPELLQGVADLGYKRPTRVQAAAIEPGLAGKDMLVRSKTGTGKTAAFCIPMIERIPSGARKLKGLVLAPTRELALQVATECAAIARYKDIQVTAIYGGVGFGSQEDALRGGAEIVVGTPGRILDHMRRGNLKTADIEMVCLDEADEMLSMGFYEDVKKILDNTPSGRQMFLFSATVDERVKGLIRSYMTDPEDLMISTDADKVEGITHILYETSPDFHKARALLALLEQEQPKSAIIFCNTREDTATVQAFLSRQGLDAELISGELPQKQREKVMAAVKRGEIQFLVATDVAARGIDISDLSHVVNYSLPEDPAVYLHRTGRTGRIGKTGTAISLAGGADMNTRNTLTRQYQIQFVVKPLPSQQEADRLRVERQVKTIQRAMGHMAFEGYLGTVRALRDRPDGEMLLAAAVRAFFLWDRMRKAADDADTEGGESTSEDRGERRERRDGDRRKGGRDRDRRERRDGDRRDRRDGERREARSDVERREPRAEGERREARSDVERREPRAEGERRDGERRERREGERTEVRVEQAEPNRETPPPADGGGADGDRKRRRRRRRRGPREGGDTGGSDTGGGDFGGGDAGGGEGGAE